MIFETFFYSFNVFLTCFFVWESLQIFISFEYGTVDFPGYGIYLLDISYQPVILHAFFIIFKL